ncbi:MAG: tetratricopeptide repeat protein [Paludibacter sp.]|nr:tetratricopeptide repeat protein [Paludibacter sp.]
MQFKYRIFIPYIFLLFVGCSLLPNKMKTAEQLMETSPDSALHLLRQIKPNQSLSSADQALYGLLLFEALDKKYLPLQPDSAINFSLDYYQGKKDKVRLARCYFYKGRMYKYAQQYDEATEMYLKALDNCQDKKDYALMGKIYGDMGYICSIQKDYVKAREKHQLAVNCLNQIGKTADASFRIIDIGVTYRCEKNYKMALQYYRKAVSISRDSILLGIAYQEIGTNYQYTRQLDSAEIYYRKSLKFPCKEFNYAIRCCNLSELFFLVSKLDSAIHYANISLKHPSSFFTQKACYRILANSKYSQGDFKQMAFYMSKYQACTDSVRKIDIQTKTTVLENIHETSQTAGKTKQYLIVLGWLIPFIIVISLFILFRLRQRNKGKEKQLVEVELQLTEKQLNLKNNFIQKIEESKSLHMEEYRKSSLAKREAMDKEVYNVCLHLNDWKVFSESMNRTFNNTVSFLEKTYPDITHKEITWCCLYLLNIHSGDMALVLDCKPESLYKLKQRLAQKMKLKTTLELNQLLKERSVSK